MPARAIARKLLRKNQVRVRYQSRNTNIYHCCVHKTASQWIRKILTDRRVYAWGGLARYNYRATRPDRIDSRPVTERVFDEPFPERTFGSHLYVDYPSYLTIPKPAEYKAFFVQRDPRDVTVSFYFSIRYSHVPMGNSLSNARETLNELSEEEGLKLSIDRLWDRYAALESWVGPGRTDPNVVVVRYEDLISNESFDQFRRLFEFLDIRIPDSTLADVLEHYSFGKMSGRAPGQEDQQAHLRKGVAGDWKGHFTDEVQAYFDEKVGDLPQRLGYE